MKISIIVSLTLLATTQAFAQAQVEQNIWSCKYQNNPEAVVVKGYVTSIGEFNDTLVINEPAICDYLAHQANSACPLSVMAQDYAGGYETISNEFQFSGYAFMPNSGGMKLGWITNNRINGEMIISPEGWFFNPGDCTHPATK
jgi:hypothetical protein